MSPPSVLNTHNSNRFSTIFPDLYYLYALKNPQLLKMYAYFGEVKRAFKSEDLVSISA